jgi:glycosyltransferase involved in cell wall biosynthesis
MKLLLITQAIDRKDTYLSFFYEWMIEFAREAEHIHVICLKKGDVGVVPTNVTIHSLGKEEGVSRLTYVMRLFLFVWKLRAEYTHVFVHMNQEYVLLCGWLWRLLGKKITMWRNHQDGSFLTNIAAACTHRLFCTSRFSYTARFAKTHFMPVGYGTAFVPDPEKRQPRSVLFLGRIAPVKRPDVLIRALQQVHKKGIQFTATIVGNALPKDAAFAESLRALVAEGGADFAQRVVFEAGVPHGDVPAVFQRHDMYVNLSPSGMYDKTIFESMGTGTITFTNNANLKGLFPADIERYFIYEEGSVDDLAEHIAAVLQAPSPDVERVRAAQYEYATSQHSLRALTKKLFRELGELHG